ncbi:MAG TPA: cell division protein ZapA [Alphaproteobacteria bacterium]|nr:cell division protein ZapA [Alphaproteobacteria bacterium]
MSKIAITLYGREYSVNCDAGQEDRLRQIVKFVEGRMQEVADKIGNTTEPRLLMLTCLSLADQLFDVHQNAHNSMIQDEDLMVAAVEHLRQRIAHIASQVGRA